MESGALLFENQRRVVALAAQYRLPAVNEWREFAESGGLLSYGQTRQENSERAAALGLTIPHRILALADEIIE